jgi:serine O-acetyltransferase
VGSVKRDDRGGNGSAAAANDSIWTEILDEAQLATREEPLLAEWLERTTLSAATLEQSLARHLASRIGTEPSDVARFEALFETSFSARPEVSQAIRRDLSAVRDRDPVAENRLLKPFLFFKGFHALQVHRVAAGAARSGQWLLAAYLQSRTSELFGVDIHPAAKLGSGLLLDHATGIVIGETAVVDDDVSILHEVTLGGTGKQTGDRHPKVRRGVLLGAGAKILGNVTIGEGAKVGAGSVVLDDVPPHCTVAGVPARIVARSPLTMPAFDMDQQFPHEFLGDGI